MTIPAVTGQTPANRRPVAAAPVKAAAVAPPAADASKAAQPVLVRAKAQGAPGYPDLSPIRTLQNVNRIAGDGLGYFSFDNMPSYQYQSTRTRTRRDGSTYTETTYNWSAAFADVRAKLSAISTIAGNEDDPQCRQVARLANESLSINNWEYLLDSGTAASRYTQLSATLRDIQQITADTPNQPGQTVGAIDSSIVQAQTAVNDLKRVLQDPTLTNGNLDSRVQQRIQQERTNANSVPFWKKLLIFGLFQKHGANATADRLQKDLNTVHHADANGLQQRLDDAKNKADALKRQAAQVTTIDGARQFQTSANPITSQADGVNNAAGGQRDDANDLIKTLNGG